ncbi:MAG TPA: hypothetical protein VFP98_00590, partial [Candidatus Polarisedimenticolia bacterium]|nr:hypothetical protein [Candidatus Polarisedimenticolia bacterium]
IITTTLFEFPLGRGLGSTTVAASKFEGGRGYEAESYFFELFYGSGLLAPALFGLICYFLVRSLLALFINWPDEFLYQVCIGFIAGTLLSSLFNVAPRDTITGPLCWLVIGWIAREEVDRRLEAAPAKVPAKVLAEGLAR